MAKSSNLDGDDVQYSVQFLDRRLGGLGWGWGDMMDDSEEIFFESFFPREAIVSSGMDMDVYSLTLSIQHFHCRSRRFLPSKVP